MESGFWNESFIHPSIPHPPRTEGATAYGQLVNVFTGFIRVFDNPVAALYLG